MSSTASVTTIKVPASLRDDLRAWADEHEESSLANALATLLARAKEEEFWRQVHQAHGADREPHGGLAPLRERLADADDDRLSDEDAW